LANASTGLASLRVPLIVEIVSVAIAEFTQSEFLGEQDPQGRVVPSANCLDRESWEQRARLAAGGLLSAGCRGAVLLAGHGPDTQALAARLGTSLALACRAHDERVLFSAEGGLGGGAPFSLAAAPVIFTLAERPDLLAAVRQHQADLSLLDYRAVWDAVAAGPGLERTQQLCSEYVDTSLDTLAMFGESEAASAVRKIALSMVEE